MASDDYGQITTIAQRLGDLLANLNPLTLASTITQAIREVQTRPPGEPQQLDALVDAYRAAAQAVEPLGEDARTIGSRQLPEIWHGIAATSATQVVTATADVMDMTAPAFRYAATALEEHAEAVRGQQRRHAKLHQALHDAYHDATHVAGLPIPDPFALNDLVSAAAELIIDARGVYTDAITSADTAAAAFADITGKARSAAGVSGGMNAADAVVLTGERVGYQGDGLDNGYDDAVLTTGQMARAGELLDAMSPAERTRVQALLDQAGGTTERAYLLKAVAAGHAVTDLTAFAGTIRGKDPTWLTNHLSLIDRGGPAGQSRFGARVDQYDGYTCGTTSLIISRAEADPLYALTFTEGLETLPDEDASFEEFERRFSPEQDRVHDETNMLYPEFIGTSPVGMTDWMNQHADATGTRYGYQLVDDTNQREISGALHDVVTAVNQGHSVPILVGGTVPRHYVTVVGHDGDDLLIFEPSNGQTVRVPAADFVDGRMGGEAGFDHVQAVIVPEG